VEWEAPGIVLAARPYGEGDALATVLTEEHGAYRGLAKGGLSRAKANLWQPGNLVKLRWAARLHDQLGSLTAEMVHPGAALAMDDAMALAILSAACAVAEGALTERESYPRVFAGLLQLIIGLGQGREALTDLVRWEMTLLTELGYGMDLSSCALTSAVDDLVWVSPRTGHAVSATAAGPWKGRLLPLPGFLVGTAPAGPLSWVEGLALTGHFLARDAFGLQHKPLPPARVWLAERMAAIVDELPTDR
jgi:DNA repair protein RecO (recombination protein O)